MKVLRWFLSGVSIGVIGELLGWLFYGVVFCGYCESCKNLWRPMDDPLFSVGMPLVDIFSGLMIALGYAVLYKGIPGEGLKKGMTFGLILWAMSRLPGELFWWTMSPVPFMLVVAGWLHGLCQLLLGGLAMAAIYGKNLEEKKSSM